VIIRSRKIINPYRLQGVSTAWTQSEFRICGRQASVNFQ
jgi:hypothetical protein